MCKGPGPQCFLYVDKGFPVFFTKYFLFQAVYTVAVNLLHFLEGVTVLPDRVEERGIDVLAHGDDHVANFVPYVVERVVGGVGAIPQLVLLDVSKDLFPGTGQERTQNTLFDRTDTGETLDAGSAAYINKESFGEIVGMVSHDNVVHFFLLAHFFEPVVSAIPVRPSLC